MLKKKQLTIVKLGSYILSNPIVLMESLALFSKLPGDKILVHGGGAEATEIGDKLGIESTMVEGRRVTDAKSLELVLMVYAGLINTQIVAKLQGLDCNAIGLSGADGNCIQATKRVNGTVDFGFVGDVSNINTGTINSLLKAGMYPVFCAISHDASGTLLNTNGDTIAAELAIAFSEEYESSLFYCFDKLGVLMDVNDANSIIPVLSKNKYQELMENSLIHSGMLPKLKNGYSALEGGVKTVNLGQISMLGSNNENCTKLLL